MQRVFSSTVFFWLGVAGVAAGTVGADSIRPMQSVVIGIGGAALLVGSAILARR